MFKYFIRVYYKLKIVLLILFINVSKLKFEFKLNELLKFINKKIISSIKLKYVL